MQRHGYGKKKMMPRLAVVALALSVAGCAGAMRSDRPEAGRAEPDRPVSDPGIPDSRIGLSKVGILETPSPDPVREDLSDPGARPLPERAYPGTPPVIPHGVADFLPITRDGNACIDCHHLEGEKTEGDPTPIPGSHFVDLRNEPSKVRGEVAGARYACTSCHAAQADAPPLVKNRFGG